MKLAQPRAERNLEDAKILWRSRNRNALRQIADEFGISYTFVRRVFLGEIVSGERRVERELARRGCPGFEELAA